MILNKRGIGHRKTTKDTKMNKKTFKTVSNWINEGGLKTDYRTLESPVKETEKAFGYAVEKYNQAANLVKSIMWIPKSQTETVKNDFYANGPEQMQIVPAWLLSEKRIEGFEV